MRVRHETGLVAQSRCPDPGGDRHPDRRGVRHARSQRCLFVQFRYVLSGAIRGSGSGFRAGNSRRRFHPSSRTQWRSTPHDLTMTAAPTYELVVMAGCPNVPAFQSAVVHAMQRLGCQQGLVELDIHQLAKLGDTRAGYGSPTLLVQGADVFGATASGSLAPSCRFYPGGLPDADAVAAAITYRINVMSHGDKP
jgi:hypothetical protein